MLDSINEPFYRIALEQVSVQLDECNALIRSVRFLVLMRNWPTNLVTFSLVVAFVLGCSGGLSNLRGAGASFPRPIYEKWISEYGKLREDVRIDYQATGSGAGQRAILTRTVDFGATDDPMSDEDLAKAKGKILHIPTVLGAVVITYNIKGVDKPLNLTPEAIAEIYLGKIKNWNDPLIAKENPEIKLPDSLISPVFRSDASGTTAVFTDFLAKRVPEFKETIGSSKQPDWVQGVGLGGQKNDGVMGQIKTAPNTIGYVELAFAKENDLPVARIKNSNGNFVGPETKNISAAATAFADEMPEDLRMNITNADGQNSYPMSSYTYILIYEQQKDAGRGKAVVDFLWWAIHDGSKFTEQLHYAPLPEPVQEKVREKLNSVMAFGKKLRTEEN